MAIVGVLIGHGNVHEVPEPCGQRGDIDKPMVNLRLGGRGDLHTPFTNLKQDGQNIVSKILTAWLCWAYGVVTARGSPFTLVLVIGY